MTLSQLIILTLATVMVGSFVYLIFKVATLLTTMNNLVNQDIKPLINKTNTALTDTSDLLKNTNELTSEAKHLVEKLTGFTEKGESFKDNVSNYLKYVQVGFDLLNKFKTKKQD